MKKIGIAGSFPALALAAIVAGCGGPGYVVKGEPVKAGLSMQQVEQAILEGAKKSGWQTIVDQPGGITATYHTSGESVVTEIVYDTRAYQIRFVDESSTVNVCPDDVQGSGTQASCELGGQSDANVGGYKGWMNQLNESIGNAMKAL